VEDLPAGKRLFSSTPQSPTRQAPVPPVYLLRLVSLRGDDVRTLRWILKTLLRRFGWRAVSVEEEARR
jgi:hypothetical protein